MSKTNIRTMECYKKPYLSREDARNFQKYRKKVEVYLCPVCAYWHISTHYRLSEDIAKRFIRMIQSGETKPIGHISNAQSVHEISYNSEIFHVIYNNRRKTVKLT